MADPFFASSERFDKISKLNRQEKNILSILQVNPMQTWSHLRFDHDVCVSKKIVIIENPEPKTIIMRTEFEVFAFDSLEQINCVFIFYCENEQLFLNDFTQISLDLAFARPVYRDTLGTQRPLYRDIFADTDMLILVENGCSGAS